MSPRQDAIRLIAGVGGELDECDAAYFDVCAWAPAGVVWRATGCHALISRNFTSRPDGWKALLTDLRAGTEPCDDPSCGHCEEML